MDRELAGLSLDDLVAELAKGDDQRRRDIAWELGRRGRKGDGRAIPILIRLFDDNGTYVDEAASEALGRI